MQNEQEKSLTGLLSSEQKFIGWVLLAIIPRGLLHFYLFNWKLGSVIFDMYYVLVLHFSLLFSIETITQLFFKQKITEVRDYYRSFIKYWAFIFPLVPIVTIISHSKYQLHIEAFKYIPTFMVDKNFLPLGMLFVIPLIQFYLIRHLMRHSGLNMLKAFLVVSIANTISYVVYYQWILQAYYSFVMWFSEITAMCCYSLFGITALLLITYRLQKREVLHKNWLKVGFIMFYIYGFILLAQMISYGLTAYGIAI